MELENVMAIHTSSRDSVLPSNISVQDNKFTHACFDNFDLLEETVNGSQTTHSTHGILIQELKPDCTTTISESYLPRTKLKLKCVPEMLPPSFCPRHVEPSICPTLTSTNAISSALLPLEQAWVLCRSQCNELFCVPLWAGWLSVTAQTAKAIKLSVIGYMAPIAQPITESDTVCHCMQLAMDAATKLNQKYCFVTMDLAAAKLAYDIKWHNADKFNNVIIHLGGFHTMCSFMGSLGKMMTGSGFDLRGR